MSKNHPVEPDIARLALEFENATVDPGEFNHEAHLMVGWWYLQRYELLEAITRFIDAIGRLTRKLGAADKYHATITWFFLLKIAERCRRQRYADWTAFKDDNPDLFAWSPGLLQEHYSDEVLNSAAARRRFVLPDCLRHHVDIPPVPGSR